MAEELAGYSLLSITRVGLGTGVQLRSVTRRRPKGPFPCNYSGLASQFMSADRR
jgi:hypothetical protein